MATQAQKTTPPEAQAYRQHIPFGFIEPRDEMLLDVQQRALQLLWEMRRRSGQVSAGFDAWAEEHGIDLMLMYDLVELGDRVAFTVAEDMHFGTHAMGRRPTKRMRGGVAVPVTAMRFPPTVPADETEAECDRRRRKFSRARRKAAMEQQEAADRAAITITGTLAERRLASLLAVLSTSPAKAISLAEAARKVAKTEAWAGLAPRSVAQFVKLMVRAHQGGLIASRPAVDGLTKLLVWRFTAINSGKVEDRPAERIVPQPVSRFADFTKPRPKPRPSLFLTDRVDDAPPQEGLPTSRIPDEGPPPHRGRWPLGRQKGWLQ
jgi:hypothetical protein